MAGKLLVVEGASGSGKDTLLNLLAEKGCTIMRGGPSQNHPENKKLTPASQQLLGNTKISLELILQNDFLRKEIVKKYLQIVGQQLQEAIARKQQGETVCLNRSVFSFMAHLRLIIDKHPGFTLDSNAKKLLKIVKDKMLRYLDGLIVMEEPLHGVIKQGIGGLQDKESQYIKELVVILPMPKLRLNANAMPSNKELLKVIKFIKSL